MKKSTKKPAKATAPAKMSPAEFKYDAFQALWTTYLHLRCWGLPEYEELSPPDKDYFRSLVAKGRDALFSHIEDCKRAVLRGGLGDQVRDEWLGIIGLSVFDLCRGFPQATRDRLGKMLDEMYPLLVRLDPDAIPPAGATAGPVPDARVPEPATSTEHEPDDCIPKPEPDPYDIRVVRWFGCRLYLGKESTQIARLFRHLLRRMGQRCPSEALQDVVFDTRTHPKEPEQRKKDLRKVVSKLRDRLAEYGVSNYVVIMCEDPRGQACYSMQLRSKI